ncbi:glucose PTS transporter subunit IIA [Anaerocolumna sp.]|uniref:glucose PTS transporter subunit IIA n=1 Tax=Anaerocolumna sp. TaxID=2041569 RepID=UPI0028AD6857|nr:glucose PTS transporter subunit IIA [Anaerocolumna sp.]
MDYIEAAKEILSGVGGLENILDISQCFTRLRFQLIDEGKVKEEQLKSIPGVYGIIKIGLEYQVVLGPEVDSIYRQLKKNDNITKAHNNISEIGNSLEKETNQESENVPENERVQEWESIKEEKSQTHISLYSPIRGTVKPLSDVNDPAFALELLGKGIAILPEDGKVYAPFNGTVVTLFSTNHAICLLSNQGVEIIIHIGLNTVTLNGKYFTTHVKTGDKVNKGELIMEYDLSRIKEIGYDTVVPIVITNSDRFNEVNSFVNKTVSPGDEIIQIINE